MSDSTQLRPGQRVRHRPTGRRVQIDGVGLCYFGADERVRILVHNDGSDLEGDAWLPLAELEEMDDGE